MYIHFVKLFPTDIRLNISLKQPNVITYNIFPSMDQYLTMVAHFDFRVSIHPTKINSETFIYCSILRKKRIRYNIGVYLTFIH